MPADWISVGVLVLSWGATYFVHSTCLIAGIWLFVRGRRTASHALRETLWKTALVGGVVTASAQMWLSPSKPFGDLTLRLEGIGLPIAVATAAQAAKDPSFTNVFDALNRPDREAEHSLRDELPPIDSTNDFWIATLDPEAEIAASSAGPSTASLAAGQFTAPLDDRSAYAKLVGTRVRALPAVLALPIAFAILAIVLGIARCGWQTISLRRKLAHCQLIDAGPARKLLDELLRTVPHTPEVLLLSAPEDSEPAAFGIARWAIVLPPRATLDLTEDELRALLAHELAHLVRGDSIWLCISRVLCSCLAFQPLNHLARREWQRTAEFLCDHWAVSRTGAPLALARCLTEVAGWRLAGPASTAILAAMGRRSGLVDRIERLLDARLSFDSWRDKRDRRRTLFAGAVVLAFLAWCAPRVQLVVAGPPVNKQPEPGRVRQARFDSRSDENDGEVSQELEVTKTRASGERQTRDAELEADESGAGPAINVQRADGDSASLLEALDRDLMALESDLEQLGPLLHENEREFPQAVSLAKRLRGEIVRLKQRREILKTLSRQSAH